MKIFKIIINSFLILFLLFGQFGIANAVSLKLNPVAMVNDVMADLGAKKSSVQNMATMANNITSKTTPPEVSLSFAPLNPKTGEKVTVNAMPTYFLNQPEKLYYTWFLKTKGCLDRELDGSDYNEEYRNSEMFRKCDLNNSGEVTIEDYKIKAMRIIANDGFNYEQADYTTDQDSDQDGYAASFGGDDQNGKEPHCFVHDIKTGNDYEIRCDKHLFPRSAETENFETGELGGSGTGNDAFGNEEEEIWHTDPFSKDTGHTGKTDEANVCGLGINNFTWDYQKGDQVGLVVEGVATLATQQENSSYKTMWAMSRKNYAIDRTINGDDFNEEEALPEEVYSDVTDPGTGIRTIKYTSVTNASAFNEDSVSLNTALTNDTSIKNVRITTYHDTGWVDGSVSTDYIPFTDPLPELGTFPGTENIDGPTTLTETDGSQYVEDTIPLTDEEYQTYYANTVFGDMPPQDVPVDTTTERTITTTTQTVVANVGTVRIPPITGPWYYEITTTPQTRIVTETEETNNEPIVVNSTTTTVTVESELSNGMTAVSDLNSYLYEALIDPSANEVSSQKLEVELSYLPEAPINDPNTDPDKNNGDVLSVVATIVNPQDDAFLNYTWEVWQNDVISTDPADWTSISNTVLIQESEASQFRGLGLNTFKFKLNRPSTFENGNRDFNFLQIRLRVEEKIDETSIREGRSSVIVPIESSSGEISAFNASIDSNLNLSLGDQLTAEEDKTFSVIKNNIIGLSFSNSDFDKFLWSIDDRTVTYKQCPFGVNGCDDGQRNAFFPVTKEVGETYTVNLIATNSEGEKINLTKVFKVVEPSIRITPATPNDDNSDNCSNIILGYYVGLDGHEYEDYSKESLISATGSDIRIKADVIGFHPTPGNYTWSVDSDIFSGNDELILPARAIAGENYSISVSATYLPGGLNKQALNEYWNLSFDDFYEKTVSDNVEIIIRDGALVGSKNTSKKIFASLFSSTPEYIAFLFRIVLTTFLIIFVSKLIFTFSPRAKE